MSDGNLLNKDQGNIPSVPMAARNGGSTMNRPDSKSLNTNASATAAAQAFAKEQEKEREFMPAIATGFVPPVVNDINAPVAKKTEASPFKSNRAPVRRPKNAANVGYKPEKKEEQAPKTETADENKPQIAKFIPIPVVEKEASPFLPAGAKPEQKTANGLKAPIKRPASASVNHAAALKEEQEKKAREEALKKQASEAQTGEAAAANPTEEKKEFTPKFVPMFAQEEKTNPFAAPVKKTEEQIRLEEERAKEALEKSRSVEVKKSKLDSIMDTLNRPIF